MYRLRAANPQTLAHVAATPNGYQVAEPANSKVAVLEHAAGRAKFCLCLSARQKLINYWLVSSWDSLFCLCLLNSFTWQNAVEKNEPLAARGYCAVIKFDIKNDSRGK